MGSDQHYPEEAPAHGVELAGFWIDRAPVTNAQFLKFVKATSYRTLAESFADSALYPDADPAQLQPASIVFVPPAGPVGQANHYSWWQYVPGASWRHPEGPGSSIKGRGQHPVVHVAHADAAAYASWIGKQLPTEEEWERAAWGGREGCEFAWGDELHPGGVPVANTFQGDFPHHNSCLDGWELTSPVGAYPANGSGLVDMIERNAPRHELQATIKENVAAVRLFQSGNRTQKRGLAASRGAEQNDEFAGCNVDGNIVQRDMLAGLGAIAFGQSRYGDSRYGGAR